MITNVNALPLYKATLGVSTDADLNTPIAFLEEDGSALSLVGISFAAQFGDVELTTAAGGGLSIGGTANNLLLFKVPAVTVGTWTPGTFSFGLTASDGTDTQPVFQGSTSKITIGWGATSPLVLVKIPTTASTMISSVDPQTAANTAAIAALQAPFQPAGLYSTQAVTTASAAYALPAGTTVVVYNTGSNAVSVAFGGASISVVYGQSDTIQPGSWEGFSVGSATYYAVIGAGASSVVVSGGIGVPSGAGGGSSGGGSGGGGTFTWPGSAAVTAYGTAPTGTVPGVNAAVTNLPGSWAVTGTFWQATQPVSLASLPALASGSNVIGGVTQSGGPWAVSWSGQSVGVSSLPALATGANVVGGVMMYDAAGHAINGDPYNGAYFLHVDPASNATDGATYNSTNVPQVDVIAGKGTDGNVHPISVDSSGNQNVNLLAGSNAIGTVGVTSEIGVGSTGASVPASAHFAGMNVSGNLVGLTGTANGLKIDGSAVTQPVSEGHVVTTGPTTTTGGAMVFAAYYNTTLPSPTAGQPVALQSDVNGYLRVNLAAASPFGVAIGGSSAPGQAIQTAGIYNASPPSLTSGYGAALQLDSAANLKTIANAGTNLNTSALALESGGNLAAIKTAVTGTLATSRTWNLAYGSDSVTIGGTLPAFAATPTVAPLDAPSAITNSLTTTGVLFTQNTTNYGSIQVQITSAGSGGTIVFEGCNDNSTWVPVSGFQEPILYSSTPSSQTGGTGVFKFNNPPVYFRARVSALTSGTVSVVAYLRSGPATVYTSNQVAVTSSAGQRPFEAILTFTRSTTVTAYAAGQIVQPSGSPTTFNSLAMGIGNSTRFIVNDVTVLSSNGAAATKGLFSVYMFTVASPSGQSSFADYQAFTPTAASLSVAGTVLCGAIPDALEQLGTAAYGSMRTGMSLQGVTTSGGLMYIAVVTNNAYTPVTGETITVKVTGLY